MIENQVTIINKLGMHARAASKFVSTASAFSSDIKIGTVGNMVEGKSIMSVMMLAACQGTELILQCDGTDEQKAMDAITTLINNFFDEGE